MGEKSVRIGVRGEHALTHAPERAVVHAAVVLDGPDPRPVHDAVAAAVGSLRTSVDALRDSGAVIEASIDQVRMSASRPWNADGTQLPLVHHASADLTVTFTDPAALADWTAAHADTEGFTVRHIDWQLTDETRRSLEQRCRGAAYEDARRRAQDYATAAGLGEPRLRRIGEGEAGAHFFAMAKASSSGGIELSPQDIRVSVGVDVVFKSRG